MPEEHCVFTVANLAAAVQARHVVEIVPMPELSALPETPTFVLGGFNLRGRAVPVISLSARLLDELRPARAADQVIVVEHGGSLVGFQVASVLDVVPIVDAALPDPSILAHASRAARFLDGLAWQGERLVALLDVERLVSLPSDEAEARMRRGIDSAVPPEERLALQDRARRLAEAPKPEPEGEREAAVVEMGGEPVALDPRRVREFTLLRDLVSVPGAPSHILGVMSLRGAVVTIVDLRPVLSLGTRGEEPRLAAIVETSEGAIGIAVERARDVVRLQFARPGEGAGRHPHFSGTAMLDGAHVSFLDLDGLLASGVLVVAEEASA